MRAGSMNEMIPQELSHEEHQHRARDSDRRHCCGAGCVAPVCCCVVVVVVSVAAPASTSKSYTSSAKPFKVNTRHGAERGTKTKPR